MAGSSKQMQLLSQYPVLEQISGGEKGRLFELSSPRVSLGRSGDNDIVLVTEGVSRNHAYIELTQEGQFLIRDNGSKNGVQVNGSAVRSAVLQEGDVVRIGGSVFRFSMGDEAPGAGVALAQSEGQAAAEYYAGADSEPAPKAQVNRRILIYGAAGLILAYVFLFSDEDKKVAAPPANSQSEAAKSLQVTEAPSLNQGGGPGAIAGLEDPTLKSAEQSVEKLEWTNSPLKEAEQYFRRGLRDYGNQSYQRAIENFEAALSLNRTHPLAQIYLARVKSESEQLAKQEMEMGIKYFDSLQYNRAIYHFQSVIQLLSHRPQEKMIKECEKYIAVARRRLQASEIFP